MWRPGTPMQISFDVNPVNDPTKIRGVPPVWYPDSELEVFLVDSVGNILVDSSDYMTAPPAP
jgi:hypothetical protein